MRILFEHQLYTSNSLRGNSMYNAFKHLVAGIKASELPIVPYYAVPSRGATTTAREIREDGFIPISGGQDGYSSYPFTDYSPTMVNKVQDKNFVVDAVVTSRYAHASKLLRVQHQSASPWRIPITVPIINWIMETPLDPSMDTLREPDVLMELASSAASQPCLVPSCDDMVYLHRIYKELLSPVQVQKAKHNTHVQTFAINYDKIDERAIEFEKFRALRKKTNQVNIFHGGSGEAKRHVRELVDIVKQVRTMLRDVEVRLVLVSQGEIPFNEDFIDCISHADEEDYINSLGRGDLLWMCSDYEGTGIASMEAMRAGMMPICNDNAAWINDRIDSKYPIRLKHFDHRAVPIVAAACKGLSRIQDEFGESVKESTRNHDYGPVGNSFYGLLNKIMYSNHRDNRKVVRGIFPYGHLCDMVSNNQLPEEVTLKDCFELMRETSRKTIDFRWMGKRALRLCLKELGYVDTNQEICAMKLGS